jgi:hypothetical protein
MPRAHVTAVDIAQANVEAAIEAGADEVFCCDIGNFEMINYQYSKSYGLPTELKNLKFDAICIDLTGGATDWLKQVVSIYFAKALLARGVLIVTLSYGRDVVEVHDWQWRLAQNNNFDRRTLRWLDNIPVNLAKRVFYVLRAKSTHLDFLSQLPRQPNADAVMLTGKEIFGTRRAGQICGARERRLRDGAERGKPRRSPGLPAATPCRSAQEEADTQRGRTQSSRNKATAETTAPVARCGGLDPSLSGINAPPRTSIRSKFVASIVR